jgi:hypothetical protein
MSGWGLNTEKLDTDSLHPANSNIFNLRPLHIGNRCFRHQSCASCDSLNRDWHMLRTALNRAPKQKWGGGGGHALCSVVFIERLSYYSSSVFNKPWFASRFASFVRWFTMDSIDYCTNYTPVLIEQTKQGAPGRNIVYIPTAQTSSPTNRVLLISYLGNKIIRCNLV